MERFERLGENCKTSIPGSNPGGASKIPEQFSMVGQPARPAGSIDTKSTP